MKTALNFKSDIITQALVAVPMKIVVWDATPCSLVDVCWHFTGYCCLLQNMGALLQPASRHIGTRQSSWK